MVAIFVEGLLCEKAEKIADNYGEQGIALNTAGAFLLSRFPQCKESGAHLSPVNYIQLTGRDLAAVYMLRGSCDRSVPRENNEQTSEGTLDNISSDHRRLAFQQTREAVTFSFTTALVVFSLLTDGCERVSQRGCR